MKIKTTLKSIWIVTILSLAAFIFSITLCCAQVYTSFSFDTNKLFIHYDNPRTETDHKGLDYDIEIGAIDENVGVFVFYGAFPNAYYSNYGAGIDFYTNPIRNVYLSLGNSYTFVARHKDYKYLGRGGGMFNPRWKIGYEFKHFNIGYIGKYSKRADLGIAIFEAQMEIMIKIL